MSQEGQAALRLAFHALDTFPLWAYFLVWKGGENPAPDTESHGLLG